MLLPEYDIDTYTHTKEAFIRKLNNQIIVEDMSMRDQQVSAETKLLNASP